MTVKKMYIDGKWTESISKKTREIINPGTGKVIATVVEGGKEDVDLAVAAARKAFEETQWKEPYYDRASILYRIADLLEENLEVFKEIETLNNGKPLREAEYDVYDAAGCFRYYAGMIGKPNGTTYNVPDNMQAMVVREPIGVCGQIVPWNYPLLMGAWKLAPALAAGNTVVFKPAEITPLSVIKLFELMDGLEIPNGVINLVLGEGKTVGAAIAEHMDVDKIAFTGGTTTGRKIMIAAANNLKNISLELGGKSPNIVFADADFETAVDYALFGIFANQGQVCSAGSRLLLEESIYDDFVTRLVERAKQIKVGNGMDDDTEMGPLISEVHMDKVLDYIDIGKKEGATLLTGGNRIESLEGYYVEPTIFGDTTKTMRIVKEEIFGPVLVIQKFSTEEEAIQLANDSVYGLAAGVFTNDLAKGHRVIKRLRAGITWLNTYHPTFNEAPWGGYKQSGIGRELGPYGFEAYTETKQINVNLTVEPIGWFKN